MDKMLEWILEMCKKGKTFTPDDMERFLHESTNDETDSENEAHILTREDFDDWNDYVWLEYRDRAVMEVELITYGIVLNSDCEDNNLMSIDHLNWGEYEREWRYWSDKPTIEQRRRTAWKDRVKRDAVE